MEAIQNTKEPLLEINFLKNKEIKATAQLTALCYVGS